MELREIGRELRAQRTVAGRTVASVASDAGLSVPYIANLENGRGNPTVTALTRLAGALGLRLEVTLVPSGRDAPSGRPAIPDDDGPRGKNASSRVTTPPGLPASLVRLGRTSRFRDTMTASAAALNVDADDFGRQIVSAHAMLAQALGGDLAEADWWRLLDAVLLVATHPAPGPLGGVSLSGSSAQASRGRSEPIAIESIGRRAVSKLGVAPSSLRSFGETFARSAAAAGLAETTGDGKVTLFSRPQAGSSDADHLNPVAGASAAETPAAVPSQAARGRAKPVLDQRWPFPDGEVALIVTIGRPLSAADFASIGKVVAQIEQLVEGLAGGEVSA